MKNDQDYIRDITEIRSMMERSSRFLSLSGWAGVMAGIYALVGAYVATNVFHFNPAEILSGGNLVNVGILAIAVLALAVGTAVVLSSRNAAHKGEKSWNATSRRLLASIAVPLLAGAILIFVLILNSQFGYIPALTMLFYGLGLFSAGNFTYGEMRYLGLLQIILGLAGSYFVEYSMLFWAVGFGVLHIVYGIYLHTKYER